MRVARPAARPVAVDGWATSGCIGRRSESVTGDIVGAWIYDARVGMSDEDAQHHATFVHEGERRFIYAARRDGAPGLVLLPERAAEARRAPTKSELMCPVPGCPMPDLTTVDRSRAGRRDGYRHLATGVDHGAERMHHVLAKGLLARWARWAMPGATAIEEHPSNEARERIADVMVRLPDGAQFALEVQYSALSVEAWRERHESYRRNGIVDVWLFGHAGAQARSRDGVMYLNATQREIAASGEPVLWINPLTEEVAYATSTAWSSGRTTILAQEEGPLRVVPLTQWRLLEDGMFTRELVELRDTTVRHLAREAAASAVLAADEAARQALRDQIVVARERDHEAWLASSERAAAMAALGEWPTWLAGEDPVGTRVSGERWRWFLWSEVIRPIAKDERVRSSDLLAKLVTQFGDAVGVVTPGAPGGSLRAAVIAMLSAMQRPSLASRHEQKRFGVKRFWFTRGSVREPLTPEQRAEVMRRASEREAGRAGGWSKTSSTDHRRGPGSLAGSSWRWLPAMPPAPLPPRAPGPGERACARCALPVAAFLVDQGLRTHPVCSR